MVKKIQIHLHDIYNRYKIAHLQPGCIAAVFAKEPHAAMRAVLVEVMECNRGHPSFMRFARAIDTEITQSDALAMRARQLATTIMIKQQFRVAVNIQGPLVG